MHETEREETGRECEKGEIMRVCDYVEEGKRERRGGKQEREREREGRIAYFVIDGSDPRYHHNIKACLPRA